MALAADLVDRCRWPPDVMLVLDSAPLDELRTEEADDEDGERDDGDREPAIRLFDGLLAAFELRSVG